MTNTEQSVDDAAFLYPVRIAKQAAVPDAVSEVLRGARFNLAAIEQADAERDRFYAALRDITALVQISIRDCARLLSGPCGSSPNCRYARASSSAIKARA